MGLGCWICKKLDKESKHSHHRFPLDPRKRKLWLNSLGFDENTSVPKHARICTNHFSPEHFVTKSNGVRYLSGYALPGSNKRIKLEHSYASSKELSGQYADADDPEEDPLLISPEDVKVEINDDIIVKSEEPDEYSCGVDENVTKFETSAVTDEPVENDNNCDEQKTSEEIVCKTEVEETTEQPKNFLDNVAAGNPFALTNCFAQVIPNTIVIPNFSYLESHNASLKINVEDLKSTNSRLCLKADKLTAANLKVKLELKALKKENAALKKENYNVLSKSESGQLDVRKLELELRCSKAREKVLEKKVSLLRAQAIRKPVRSMAGSKTAIPAVNATVKKCRTDDDVLLMKQYELNEKYLEQEAQLKIIEKRNQRLLAENANLCKRLVSVERTMKETIRRTCFRKDREFKNALKQLQTLNNTLDANCKQLKDNEIKYKDNEIKYKDELEKARQVILTRNTTHNLIIGKLRKELADAKNVGENEHIDKYKETVKRLKVELSTWKEKYNREKSLNLEKEVICKRLNHEANSLNMELQKTKENKQKEEELKTCKYCGFNF